MKLTPEFVAARAELCGHGCSMGVQPEFAAIHERLHKLKKDDWRLLKQAWIRLANYAADKARALTKET